MDRWVDEWIMNKGLKKWEDGKTKGLSGERVACHLQKQHWVTDAVQLLPGLLVLMQHLGPFIQSIHNHLHLVHSIPLPLLQCSPYFLFLLLQVSHQIPEVLFQDGLLIGGETLDAVLLFLPLLSFILNLNDLELQLLFLQWQLCLQGRGRVGGEVRERGRREPENQGMSSFREQTWTGLTPHPFSPSFIKHLSRPQICQALCQLPRIKKHCLTINSDF